MLAPVRPDLPGPEHEEGVPFDFFNLHVWAWAENRTGLFSDTNPRIHCR